MTGLDVSKRTRSINVVTLGDSLAWGAGDERDGGIAGRLDRILIDRGFEQVQATNLGVNGAQTADVMRKLTVDRVRSTVAAADLVILSAGANDLFRTPDARNRAMVDPVGLAETILMRIRELIDAVAGINPKARIYLLGGYNPVPRHPLAPIIDQYLAMWESRLTSSLSDRPLVRVVKMSDVVSPTRLSRFDAFHPGAEAYQKASERIAELILAERDPKEKS